MNKNRNKQIKGFTLFVNPSRSGRRNHRFGETQQNNCHSEGYWSEWVSEAKITIPQNARRIARAWCFMRFFACAQNDSNRSGFSPTKGFTLAEVLITLVIIGVVAALTVPTMIAKYQEEQTITSVKKFYSEISQAYNSAIAKNGPPDTWNWEYGGEGAEHIMDILAPHLRIMTRCGAAGAKGKCFGDTTYKSLNPNVNWGVGNPGTYGKYAASRLDNGFVFWTYVCYARACNAHWGTSPQLYRTCGGIGVDINGYKKPNQLGKDVFYFYMTKYGIVPIGTINETAFPLNEYCQKSGTRVENGYACSAWILQKGNMNYLHENVKWVNTETSQDENNSND